MTTYRLGSSPAVHTPGILAWAINGYAFQQDRQRLLDLFCVTFSSVPSDAFESLLSKAVPYTVDGETVVFTVEGLCCTNRVMAEVPPSPDGLIPQLP